MTVNETVNLLLQAREAYYNGSEPIMSDEEFDRMEASLRENEPDHPYFSLVGVRPEGGRKIRHSVPMLSMAKAKTLDDVARWMERLKLPLETPFCVQPKIDGLSAACLYIEDRLAFVATRGDGVTGQDITHVAEYMQDVPAVVHSGLPELEVRGELYLPRDTPFNTEGRPLRNSCVGLINRKENRDEIRYVRFVAYQMVRTALPLLESERIEFLKRTGFHSVPYVQEEDLDGIREYYDIYLETLRKTWEFETDGLILTVDRTDLHAGIDSRWIVDHHHHYAIAFKPPAESRTTRLKGIEWNVSRQGNLIPVALFDPVAIGGAVLKRATLHNAAFVRDLRLHIGDTVAVERANDVIPYVRENLTSHEDVDRDLVPHVCPSCGADLHDAGVHARCGNAACREKKIQKIIYWVRQSGIENIAEATVRRLYDAGVIQSIGDLYKVEAETLLNLDGFADKKTDFFLRGMRESHEMEARDLIARLGIPLVQKKALAKLGIESVKDFLDFDDVSYAIGRNLIEWKTDPENMRFFREILEVVTIKESDRRAVKGKICMTGTGPKGRKEIIRDLESGGYEFSESVTAETCLLLCDDPEGGSSKLKKARSFGTRIMTYTDFYAGLKEGLL